MKEFQIVLGCGSQGAFGVQELHGSKLTKDVDMQEAHQQAQQQKPAAERSISGSGQVVNGW